MDEKMQPLIGMVTIKKNVIEKLKMALGPFIDEIDKLTANDEIDSPTSLGAHLAVVFSGCVVFLEQIKSRSPNVIAPYIVISYDYLKREGLTIDFTKSMVIKNSEDVNINPGNGEVH